MPPPPPRRLTSRRTISPRDPITGRSTYVTATKTFAKLTLRCFRRTRSSCLAGQLTESEGLNLLPYAPKSVAGLSPMWHSFLTLSPLPASGPYDQPSRDGLSPLRPLFIGSSI